MSAVQLKYFTRPEILQQIGHIRLPMFLAAFADDLKAVNFLLPTPPDPDGPRIPDPAPDSPHAIYFASIATFLSNPAMLPERLRTTLFTLEAAASDENRDRLQETFQRRLPCLAVSPCALDRALDLWFGAPDELSQFQGKDERETDVRFHPATPQPGEGDIAIELRPLPSETAVVSPSPLLEDHVPQSGFKSSGIQIVAELGTHWAGERRPFDTAALNSMAVGEAGSVPTPITIENHPAPSGTNIKNGDRSSDDSYARELLRSHSVLPLDDLEPWPGSVDGKALLDALASLLRRFVVLPKWAAETLALWVLHTYLFKFRDVTTYIGIESPEKRCGKTTLLTVLSELVNRPVVSTNISSPAFFRVIEEVQPTLLIDEADTFLQGNHELRGILNSGYHKKTAYVVRVTHQEPGPRLSTFNLQPSTIPSQPSASSASRLVRFSCWCPKALAAIGRLPDTLADRCILVRMQRKTNHEKCDRLRNLETKILRQQCARFALDHSEGVASAKPDLPSTLNDRSADIWEPLLVLADLAGGEWPHLARQAAVSLSASAQDSNPIASLLLDISLLFSIASADRMFSRTLIEGLAGRSTDRFWAEARKGKELTELWLAQQLRPYGIRPRTLWIGEAQAKGYFLRDFTEAFQRYISRTEAETFLAELRKPAEEAGGPSYPPAADPNS